jgi:hypothetical protein
VPARGARWPSSGGATIGPVRRLLTWIVVSLGIAALVRRLRRREEQQELAPPPEEPDPAAELRQKLAETRAEEAVTEPPVSPETSVEERRASVHEQGRATVDEMRGPDTDQT